MRIYRYAMLFCLFHNIGQCFIVNNPLSRLRSVPLRRFAAAIPEKYFTDINSIKDKKDAKKTMVRLNKDLSKHDYLYHTASSPSISDAEYDRLVGLAESIAKKFPDLRSIVSKFTSVGSPPGVNDSLLPYEHSRPMLSLENSFTEEGTKKFMSDVMDHCAKHHPTLQSVPFVVEPKVDGLSLSVRYVNDKMVRAGTRGDGSVGEDVTAGARYLLDLPQSLSSGAGSVGGARGTKNRELEVRGEVYINTADFEKLNQPSADALSSAITSSLSANARNSVGGNQFANSRNAAAGTLRAHNSSLVAERKLRFVAYDLALGNSSGEELSQVDSLDMLSSLGFVTPLPRRTFHIPIPANHDTETRDNSDVAHQEAVDSLLQYCKQVELGRAAIGYDTDGTVIKVSDVAVRNTMGTRQRSPRWALALKYSPKEAATQLLGITVQVPSLSSRHHPYHHFVMPNLYSAHTSLLSSPPCHIVMHRYDLDLDLGLTMTFDCD
jgi:DNA ligase (NAD+)